MRFKNFLTEAAANNETIKYERLNIQIAIDILNEHCKDALWMLHENKPIYRGFKDISLRDTTDFMIVDPSKTLRKSQNTSNFYTLILDNHPQRRHFPKRSRSFIATTDKIIAKNYGTTSKDIFILIPFDNIKIGIVNKNDMYDTKIKLPFISNNFKGIERINYWFETLEPPIVNNINSMTFLEFEKGINELQKTIPEHDLMDEIWKAYSAKSTGHTVETTKTMSHSLNSEVWIGGPCVMISLSMWEKLKKSLHIINS